MNPDHDLDTRLVQALEQAPTIRIPSGFAQRVAQQAALQPRPLTPRPMSSWGVRAAWASTALLLLAMFALALHAHHSGWGVLTIEGLYAAELATAALGLMAAGKLA